MRQPLDCSVACSPNWMQNKMTRPAARRQERKTQLELASWSSANCFDDDGGFFNFKVGNDFDSFAVRDECATQFLLGLLAIFLLTLNRAHLNQTGGVATLPTTFFYCLSKIL